MKAVKLIIIVLAFALQGCNLFDYIDAGDTITEKRPISSLFSAIEINGMFSVTLVHDSVSYVDVTCPSNLQHLIDVDVANGVLKLGNNIEYRYLSGYNMVDLEIHYKEIGRMAVNSPANISTSNPIEASSLQITCGTLFFECEIAVAVGELRIYTNRRGYATFNLKGSANTFVLDVYRMNSVWANDLEVENCRIMHDGMEDVYLNVQNLLNADICFDGNVYYYGNPQVVRTGDGKGKAIQIGIE